MTAAPNTPPLPERFRIDTIAASVVACLRDPATANQLLTHIADRMLVVPERIFGATVDGVSQITLTGANLRLRDGKPILCWETT